MSFLRKNAKLLLLFAVIMMAMLWICTEQAFAATTYESEPNNQPYQADEFQVENKGVFKGNFDSDREDWMKIVLPYSGKITLVMEGVDAYELTLYNGIGTAISVDDSFLDLNYVKYNDALGYARCKMTYYLSKGVYYLNASDDYLNHTSYTITMQYQPCKSDFAEPNDYVSTASEVKTGKVYHAILGEGRMVADKAKWVDIDFIKVKIPVTGYYYFNCKFSNTDYRAPDGLSIDEYDRNGNERKLILYESESDNGKDYTRAVELVHLKKGTHYFRIGRDQGRNSQIGNASAYSISISPKLSKVTGVKVSKTGAGKAKITWKKKSGATGYRIYRKSPSTGKYVYIGKTKNTYFIDKKAKSGRTNYYKVKPYRYINGYTEHGYYSNAIAKKI